MRTEKQMRKIESEKGQRLVPNKIKELFDVKLSTLSKYNPYDIKGIWHPVDFVIFNGLKEKKDVDDIIFLSTETKNNEIKKIRTSIKNVIKNENYDWKVARVGLDGTLSLK